MAHPIYLVIRRTLRVNVVMMRKYAINFFAHVAVENSRQVSATKKSVAAVKGLLLRHARELDKALGPAGSPITTAAASGWHEIDQWFDQPRADKCRQPAVARCQHASIMAAVTREYFVGS